MDLLVGRRVVVMDFVGCEEYASALDKSVHAGMRAGKSSIVVFM